MTDNEAPKSLGRYQILRELGHGAMGIVYEGLDPNIGRRVAIKTARRDVLQASGRADEMMERFLREAKAAGALNHPNIITIYDADEEADGLAYIAMEYLDGQDLFKLFREKRRFDVKDAVEIGATVCTALAHAHEHGVVHRDVKPSNIIMLSNGQMKVADFGIARVSDSNLTQEGAMIGTPHYMSPEQFMGHKVDARSDLFSVGIILYELLTGEKPFAGEALSAVMHNVIKVNPVAPRELNFAVNECLSRVIMKAMSKDPAERYQDGNAMAAALRESLKESPDPSVTRVGAVAPQQAAAETLVSGAVAAATVLGTNAPGETLAAGAAGAAGPVGVQDRRAPVAPSELTDSQSKRRKVILGVGAVVLLSIIVAAGFLIRGGNYYEQVTIQCYKMPADAPANDVLDVKNNALGKRTYTDVNAEPMDTSVTLVSPRGKKLEVKVSKGTGGTTLGPEWTSIEKIFVPSDSDEDTRKQFLTDDTEAFTPSKRGDSLVSRHVLQPRTSP